MKGTKFRRILGILLAVLFCIGMMPVSAVADGYAAANELRVMQTTRQEIDSELLELEGQLRSGNKTVVETVDRLFGSLKDDSRIEKLDRQSDTAFSYTLKSGMTVVYDYNIVHGIREGVEPVELDLKQEETRQIAGDNAVTSSSSNVVVYSPYFGIDEGFANYYPEQIAPVISEYTGGTLTVYAGNDCDVNSLRDIVNYGIVFFDSHGLEHNGLSYVCIYNESGITADDFNSENAVGIVGGGAGLNHNFFRQILSGRMPGSYMHFATCSGGSDGQLFEYFLSIGASVTYGYDNTVTVAYDLYLMQDFMNSMRGAADGIDEVYNIGQALAYGKSRRGNYDPYFYNSDGEYTYPVLKGNSNWYLPPLYTVDFVSGAAGITLESIRVTKDTVLNVSDFPIPPTLGYGEFLYWEGPTGTISESIVVTGNMTITAVYNVQKCTVQWVDSVTDQTIASIEVNKGETVMRESFPEPNENEGYVFVCWYLNGSEFSDSSWLILENTTFEAIYVANPYTFWFVNGLTGEQCGYMGVFYGDEISVSSFPIPNYLEGYAFVGWQDEQGNFVEGTVNVTGNATFTAIFEIARHTVAFEDGQGNTITTVTVSHGSSITIDMFPTPPEWENHTFSHWRVVSPDPYDVEFGIAIWSDMVVRAIYNADFYTVTFVDGYTNEAISSIDAADGAVINVSDFPTVPMHDGMSFVGWFINDQQVETETVTIEADVSIVAVYEEIPVVPGDINGDGEIEAEDALIVMRHAMVLTELTEEEAERADVNRDGVVNTIDALLTLRMALGIIEPLGIQSINTFEALDR